uniref:C2 domain-containing protein n=1 Tax=Steinernema glaseri TaxID=37863 RepID=A0A1I7ZIA9_9BILA
MHKQKCTANYTYIRVAALTQYGEELGKHKTDVVRSTSDPVYNDTAVFSIPLNELDTSSVKVEVFSYCGVWRKKVPLGYTCLGENSTTPDQQEHWFQMIQGMGTTVSKWHHLTKPNDHPTLLPK